MALAMDSSDCFHSFLGIAGEAGEGVVVEETEDGGEDDEEDEGGEEEVEVRAEVVYPRDKISVSLLNDDKHNWLSLTPAVAGCVLFC